VTEAHEGNVATLRGWDESPESTPTMHATFLGPLVFHGTPATHLRIHPLDDVGCAWVPDSPALTAIPGIEVVGVGAVGISDLARLAAATTSVHAVGRLSRRVECDQFTTTDETPLLEERQVRVFISGYREQILRLLAQRVAQRPRETRDIGGRAVQAISDLRRWLGLSQSGVADLCGFSLRASRYWESGETTSPRPSSVRRLFEVHAFVGSLVARLGEQDAITWLRSPVDEGGELRETVLSRLGGVQLLLRGLAPTLFAEAPRPELPPTEAQISGEFSAGDEEEIEDRTPPARRTDPPRRPRKAPRRS
jgi:DNA-binding transcriptional regulator YiaG